MIRFLGNTFNLALGVTLLGFILVPVWVLAYISFGIYYFLTT